LVDSVLPVPSGGEIFGGEKPGAWTQKR